MVGMGSVGSGEVGEGVEEYIKGGCIVVFLFLLLASKGRSYQAERCCQSETD
jgi:hypothetical protein